MANKTFFKFDDDDMDLSMEEFEKALEDSFVDNEIQAGDKVSGRIVSMGETDVFLDIGAKSEGILPVEEIIDENGKLLFTMGDRIDVTVLKVSDEIHLSYKMRKKDQSREILQEAFNNRIPVQGRVTGVNKGGFDIDLGGQRAFCPISQIDTEFVEDPQKYNGHTFHFIITKYDSHGRNMVVNRSVLLKEEAAEKARETLKNLKPGLIMTGVVKRLQPFGVFVDIGGIDGLAHISELSWDRINDPAEILKVGDSVPVKILSIEDNGKRISLSIRATQTHPWDQHIGIDIQEGKTYPGVVMRIEKFGAFIKLMPGIEGLLHISDMTWGKKIHHPKEILDVGDSISVQILGIDEENRRISLGIKQLQMDPWDEMADRLIPGNSVEADISAIKPAGMEVLIGKDLVGFIPASMSGVPRGEKLVNAFKPGQTITAIISEADRESRRIILSISNTEGAEEDRHYQEYLEETNQKTEPNDEKPIGSFGQLLARAMEKKQKPSKPNTGTV